MRESLKSFLLAVLLAGVHGSDVALRVYPKGHFVDIVTVTFPDTASRCYLVTPSGTEIDLPADETLSSKYEHRTNTLSACIVRINNLDENDEGLWTLNAVIDSTTITEQAIIEIERTESSEENPEEQSIENVSEETSATSKENESDDIPDDSQPNAEEDANVSSAENSKPQPESSDRTESSEGNPEKKSNENVSEETSAISKENDSDEIPDDSQPDAEEDTNVSSAENSNPQPESSDRTESSEGNPGKKSNENVSEETSAISKENESDDIPDDSQPDAEEDTNVSSAENSNPQPESSDRTESSEGNPEKKSNENVSEETSAISKENESDEIPDDSQPDAEQDTNVSSAENSNPQPELSESSSSEEVEVQWLNEQNFRTRTGLTVDINIPRIPNIEDCTLITPDGKEVPVSEPVDGVTVHSRSDYVSCRVVVGPMEESLIGQWTLCGSYFQDEVQNKRCLRANIAWRNAANPGAIWQTTIQPKFDHVVHFGGTLTPAVRGSGTVATCHLVTRNNEDLVITRDSEYADIQLVQNTDSACSISIGPLAQAHLGDWEIYGTFDSSLWGFNEVRLPMHLELYDINNPYDQAYNVTILNPTQHVVNLGSIIEVGVTSAGAVDACSFTMPSGTSYTSNVQGMPTGVAYVNDNRISCRLSIGPITDYMIGEWLLVGKFSNRGIFTERRLTFTIIQEDPSNPIMEDRRIDYLAEQNIDTDIGASHRIVIGTVWNTLQSCHIRTPDGLQYTIMEGFNIPGITVESGSNIACGITVQVNEDLIGNWTLISREISSSVPIERRLPFNIYVEEFIDALPREITITAGNALHVRLANPTSMHDTCHLVGPDGEPSPLARPEERYSESCGFVVSFVDADHAGTWYIVYGEKIIYKAPVVVTINARLPVDIAFTWFEHHSISTTIGPEDTMYCRVLTPQNVVAFDDFGRCRVDIERVLLDQHDGIWTMFIGLPGRIVTEEHSFYVAVKGADAKPKVSATVWQEKPIVELTCSVTSAEEKTGCLYRNPRGEVLVASQGVSEGRYAFHVNQTSLESGEFHYSCALHIADPVTSDLGLWRCDLESNDDVYYGFSSVLCPWAMQDPAVAATVDSEPVLTPQERILHAWEGESVALQCAARAPLRYCYVRAPNGTVYNLSPGVSSSPVEYAGAGLDAGECGARVVVRGSDNGTWSCHAGFTRGPEQFYPISVFVQEEFTLWSTRESGRLVVEGRVANDQSLDYCRFVRIDGHGFTSDAMPWPYADESDLANGLCRMRVPFSDLDLQPWTLVAKIRNRDGEISRVAGNHWVNTPVYTYNRLYMWLPFMMVLSLSLLALAAFAPARNRRWAAERAAAARTSLRLHRLPSFRKQPLTTPAA